MTEYVDLDQITPTTLHGVKKLAKRIKKVTVFTHTQSLEIAAKQAGFQTYTEAHNHLPE